MEDRGYIIAIAAICVTATVLFNWVLWSEYKDRELYHFIDRTMKLRYGMTKDDVRAVLGNPSFETDVLMVWRFIPNPLRKVMEAKKYYEFIAVFRNGKIVAAEDGFYDDKNRDNNLKR